MLVFSQSWPHTAGSTSVRFWRRRPRGRRERTHTQRGQWQCIITAREWPCLDDTHGVVDAVTILVARLVEARKVLHEQLQGLRWLTSKRARTETGTKR